MEKSKLLVAMMVFVLSFACVFSCDDENEKLSKETRITSDAGLVNKSVHTSGGRLAIGGFDGTEGDPIDLETAKRWVANFKATTKNPNEVQAHFFGFEILQQILNESGCVGMRMYYALDDAGEKKLLLVGVDAAGEEILPATTTNLVDGGDIIADFSYPCPDYCSGNGLNNNN